MTTLSQLIERVEAATEGSRELDARIHFALNPDQQIMVYPGTLRPPKREASYISLCDFPLDGWEDWDALALTVGAAAVSTSTDAVLTLRPNGLVIKSTLIAEGLLQVHEVWFCTLDDEVLDGTIVIDGYTEPKPPALALLTAILKARQTAAQPAKQSEARSSEQSGARHD